MYFFKIGVLPAHYNTTKPGKLFSCTLLLPSILPSTSKHNPFCKREELQMSWVRVLANVVVQGTAVFGKAFMQAYANAAVNAGKTAAEGAQAVVKRGQMTREEAIEILGVTADLWKEAPEEVNERYEKFLAANDPSNGGSFYLQSKIFRAKEFLDEEIRVAKELEEELVEGMDGTEYEVKEKESGGGGGGGGDDGGGQESGKKESGEEEKKL